VLESEIQQEQLIEALLTLARSQRGLDHREPLDLADITREAVRDRERAAAVRALRLDVTLRPAPCSGDPQLIERLAANLLDNAVRHNVVEGRIEVVTGTRGGRAILSVSNSGPVIGAAEVARLFRPFQRLADSRAHQDGHGLGLCIVAAIADAHDAVLTARAQPDGGLSIEVSLPLP
jgi:signal transduction histidine kinase